MQLSLPEILTVFTMGAGVGGIIVGAIMTGNGIPLAWPAPAEWQPHMDSFRTYWRRRRWYGWQIREMTQTEVIAHLDKIGLMPKLRQYAANLRADKESRKP